MILKPIKDMGEPEIDDIINRIFGHKKTEFKCAFCGSDYDPIRSGQNFCTLTCEFMSYEMKNGFGIIPPEIYEKIKMVDVIAVMDYKIRHIIESSQSEKSENGTGK